MNQTSNNHFVGADEMVIDKKIRLFPYQLMITSPFDSHNLQHINTGRIAVVGKR